MFKGTTPTHIFEIPIDISLIQEVKITYSQEGEEILVKRLADCTLSDGKVSTRLTQEDTFKFDSSFGVSIQIRILTVNGDALISNVITKSVGECLDDEVLK